MVGRRRSEKKANEARLKTEAGRPESGGMDVDKAESPGKERLEDSVMAGSTSQANEEPAEKDASCGEKETLEEVDEKSLNESRVSDRQFPAFRSVEFIRESVPVITEHLEVIRKIGEGTFATVYLAESRTKPPVRFALKALVPNVHSSRIENELRLLSIVGGRQNVIRLLSAMRYRDLVFLLMPYVEHESFSEYYLKLGLDEVKEYMRNLLMALRHIHYFGVVHRDVKPSNFLHNRKRKTFALVDFGLAHAERGRRRSSDGQRKRSASRDCFAPSQAPRPRLSLGSSSASHAAFSEGFGLSGADCRCGDRLATCHACAGLPAMGQGAMRGGTCGYRAPEVLLRCVDQTVAIDVWSAGMIFASFMAGRCPPLLSSSDNDYLHKLVYLCGYERMQAAGWQVGRRLLVEPAPAPDTSASYAERLRLRLASIGVHAAKAARPRSPPPPPPPPPGHGEAEAAAAGTQAPGPPAPPRRVLDFPAPAFDLLARMLDPNPSTRVSARDALRHPFLQQAGPPARK